jgi:ATPases with chaperone activity, ATP-binding subunit
MKKKRENFLEELLAEAAEARNIILLIDNIDHYLSFGEGRGDLTTTIEKFAKTDAIQFIGITEPFAYQKFIYPNEKISRLFEKVDVYEVSIEEAEKIILENFEILETRHQVFFSYETIKNAINKANFYITEIPFPEKAIDLLDLAAVFQRKKLNLSEKQWTVVLPEAIDQVLQEKTHIPTSVTPALSEKLLNLEKILSNQIIQQEEAINQLAQALRRSFLLLGKRKKPLASFLFLGPTGVGKTETAKAVAKLFFGSEKYLLRFDMSLYQTKEDIANLIGSIDTGNPGLLTKAIREQPYGVLLLDELEKANKDLINIFLTLLDEGYFTDGFGKKVDGKNLVIIATSNAGADLLYSNINPINTTSIIDNLIARGLFSPEFLNRFDGVIVFKPLTNQSILDLAKKMVEKIKQDLYQLYQVKILVDENFLTKMVEENYNEKFGARNLERILREKIEDHLAKIILAKKPKENEVIEISGD